MSLSLYFLPVFWAVIHWLRDWLLNRQESKHRLPSLDPVSKLYLYRSVAIEENINARAELD